MTVTTDYADAGWTTFTESVDTIKIYVSATGSDTNDGLTTSTPVATPNKAKNLIRDGYADWILFKAGDTWTGDVFGRWELDGRSASEPILIGSYGTGDRPKFDTQDTVWFNVFGAPRSNIVFRGIELYDSLRDPGHANYTGATNSGGNIGIRNASNGGDFDWHIEDCKFSFCSKGVSIAPTGGLFSGLTIHRCIFENNWSDNDRGAGVYTTRVRDITVTENVFDHNGHTDGATDVIYSRGSQAHNCYFDADHASFDLLDRIQYHRNINTRGSAHGTQMRPGCVASENVYEENPLATFTNNQASTITNDVILRGVDITASLPRGAGIECLGSDLTCTGVIVANRAAGVGTMAAYYDGANAGNVTLTDCMTINWLDSSGNPYLFDQAASSTVTGHITDTAGMLDATRDLAAYNGSLGGTATLDAFLAVVNTRARGAWDTDYAGDTANAWIAAGFAESSPPPASMVPLAVSANVTLDGDVGVSLTNLASTGGNVAVSLQNISSVLNTNVEMPI